MAIILVRAEGEHERVLKETGPTYVLEPLFVAAIEVGSFHWIPYIDPYGDTVFNGLQVVEVLKEWERLAQYASSAEQRAAVREVQEVAELCLEGPHRYLRFVGD